VLLACLCGNSDRGKIILDDDSLLMEAIHNLYYIGPEEYLVVVTFVVPEQKASCHPCWDSSSR